MRKGGIGSRVVLTIFVLAFAYLVGVVCAVVFPRSNRNDTHELIDSSEIPQDSTFQDIDISSDPAHSREPVPVNRNEHANSQYPLSGVVIGIDAGHQEIGNSSLEQVSPDSSEMKAKVSTGTQGVTSRMPEYVVNLDVALLLEQYLKELGAETVMVRETHDVDISNKERATLMNDMGVDLCIRIHCNGSVKSEHKGAMMLVPGRSIYPDVKEKSYGAGVIIFNSFLNVTQADDFGVIYRDDLTGFNWSKIPVCLIEMGFMSNLEEDLLLASTEYQELCAQGLAEGILQW